MPTHPGATSKAAIDALGLGASSPVGRGVRPAVRPARPERTTRPPRSGGFAAAPTLEGGVAAFVRPNGSVYHPRTVGGHRDVDVLRACRAIKRFVALKGSPGTGKTALVEGAFGEPLITVNSTGDTTADDLLGGYVPTPDGRYLWQDGPLVIAMREGRPLFVDDAHMLNGRVSAVLYSATDGRGRVSVPAHPDAALRDVAAADGFFVVVGVNPTGNGGGELVGGLESRFAAHIVVESDYELARSMKVPAKVVKVAKRLSGLRKEGQVGWAPEMREMLAFVALAKVLGEEFAVRNLISSAPLDDQEVVAAEVTAVWGQRVDPLSVGPTA